MILLHGHINMSIFIQAQATNCFLNDLWRLTIAVSYHVVGKLRTIKNPQSLKQSGFWEVISCFANQATVLAYLSRGVQCGICTETPAITLKCQDVQLVPRTSVQGVELPWDDHQTTIKQPIYIGFTWFLTQTFNIMMAAWLNAMSFPGRCWKVWN